MGYIYTKVMYKKHILKYFKSQLISGQCGKGSILTISFPKKFLTSLRLTACILILISLLFEITLIRSRKCLYKVAKLRTLQTLNNFPIYPCLKRIISNRQLSLLLQLRRLAG